MVFEIFWQRKLPKLWYTSTLGILFTDITSGTLKSTDITKDFIDVTHSSDIHISNNGIIDGATVRGFDTNTHDIADSNINSKTHIINPTSISINSTYTNEISTSQGKKAVDIPILLYSLSSGLLGLFSILCITGILLKCKSKSEETVSRFSLTPLNPSFHR